MIGFSAITCADDGAGPRGGAGQSALAMAATLPRSLGRPLLQSRGSSKKVVGQPTIRPVEPVRAAWKGDAHIDRDTQRTVVYCQHPSGEALKDIVLFLALPFLPTYLTLARMNAGTPPPDVFLEKP